MISSTKKALEARLDHPMQSSFSEQKKTGKHRAINAIKCAGHQQQPAINARMVHCQSVTDVGLEKLDVYSLDYEIKPLKHLDDAVFCSVFSAACLCV